MQGYRPSTAPCASPNLVSPRRLRAGAFFFVPPTPLHNTRRFHRASPNNISHMQTDNPSNPDSAVAP